jgi:hypothetical protein
VAERFRRVLPGLVDSCLRNIRGGLNFNLIWGKAPLADNFAAPVEKDPLVDVNVQRQSTTRQGAAGNALDSHVDLRLTASGAKRPLTGMSVLAVPAQPVYATQALNLSLGGKLQGLRVLL